MAINELLETQNSLTKVNKICQGVNLGDSSLFAIDFAPLIAAAVLFAFSFVFKYGVLLQELSDETLQVEAMAIILNLDQIMADRKMSLNELADRVGITNVNMSRIKTGKIKAVRFSTLNAICKVLQCEPGDILKYIEDDDGEALVDFDET